MRATEHAPRDPFRLLERIYGFADIVERGGWIVVERIGVRPPQCKREMMTLSENTSRRGYRFAQQCFGLFELLETKKGFRVIVGC